MARSNSPKPPAREADVRYFRNASPQGALELPLVGAVVPRGGLVAVPAERAERIEHQDVWVEVDAADALAELESVADDGDDDTEDDQPADESASTDNESTDNEGDQS